MGITQVNNNLIHIIKEENIMMTKAEMVAIRHQSARKISYGVGYAVATVKNEVGGVIDKITATDTVQEAIKGYYDGKADADLAYAQRCIKREEKAIAKANKKALEQAVNEIIANAK